MRVPVGWLRSYCDPGWDPESLAERLAMTGTEVERVDHVGAPSPESYVVGRVLKVENHPDADKLRVCEVDTGEDSARTIVCGAPNVAAEQLVAVALPGAVLPNGEELKQAKLRGVTSDGMILSEAELEIGEDAAGIAVLDGDAQAGDPLADVVAFSEPVLELEVTSNRPDCLAVYGVAREVHAISEADLAPAPWEQDAEAEGDGDVNDLASIEVKVPALCPRFAARVFTEVEVGPSPLWLKARLLAAGQRPINNVVDITNYAMLETGQPMHAYDLDKVAGSRLIIDTAKQGEKLTTLDGIERTFDVPDAVLIYDGDGPAGIAGIMGGAASEVSEDTTRVLLEVANWDGVNILRTSRALGLRSEASGRFEKQLHPELALRGQRVASNLITEICGAKLVPGTIDATGEIPDSHQLELRAERVTGLLGMEIPAKACAADLERLGFDVKLKKETLTVTVPPERHYDVYREADLVEEVARVQDLDQNLPSTLPSTGGHVGVLTREQRLLRRAEDTLRDLGCDEIISWSFNDPGLADRLQLTAGDLRRKAIEVSNPLSAEQSVMRTTLLGGLLDAARLNLSRGAEGVRLFESGRVYLKQTPEPGSKDRSGGPLGGEFLGDIPAPACEPHHLGGILSGSLPASWRGEGPGEPDYFAGKAVAEGLFAALGAPLEVAAPEDPEPFLHPGRSAVVRIDGSEAGWIGELHPLVARAWDLPGGVAFELVASQLAAAAAIERETYEDLITYPAVLQDLAVVVPEDIPAASVRETVIAAGGELLQSADVFDHYAGEQVGDGKVSLALRLEFRSPERTLTDEDVTARRTAIADALSEIGGTLRE